MEATFWIKNFPGKSHHGIWCIIPSNVCFDKWSDASVVLLRAQLLTSSLKKKTQKEIPPGPHECPTSSDLIHCMSWQVWKHHLVVVPFHHCRTSSLKLLTPFTQTKHSGCRRFIAAAPPCLASSDACSLQNKWDWKHVHLFCHQKRITVTHA